jgi:hypothetical protein
MIAALPIEAATLRAAFLAFVGKRTVAEVCRFYALPYFTVQRWCSHGAALPPWLEKQMVDKLCLETTESERPYDHSTTTTGNLRGARRQRRPVARAAR